MTAATRRALVARAFARASSAREILLEAAEDLERSGCDRERAVAHGIARLLREELGAELAKILS